MGSTTCSSVSECSNRSQLSSPKDIVCISNCGYPTSVRPGSSASHGESSPAPLISSTRSVGRVAAQPAKLLLDSTARNTARARLSDLSRTPQAVQPRPSRLSTISASDAERPHSAINAGHSTGSNCRMFRSAPQHAHFGGEEGSNMRRIVSGTSSNSNAAAPFAHPNADCASRAESTGGEKAKIFFRRTGSN